MSGSKFVGEYSRASGSQTKKQIKKMKNEK